MGAVSEVADVTIDDRLVVALGDSVASGEGNPQGPNLWLDPPCHRSASAGFEQAARLLSQGLTRRSITFVSLACSGAEVEKGLLGRYAGVAPDPRVREYAPQLTRLEAINRARPSTSGRPGVDAVLVSVGANDVQFSSIVKSCSAPGDCRRGHERQVFADLGRLRGNYDRLGSRLNGSLAGAPVVITEYFDPTRDERGAFCRQSVAFTTQGEARWAYEALLRPLNAEVAAASVRNGWRYVGGIATDFEHHGYCADKAERWVRRLSGSLFAQGDLLGTLHPSFEGHLAIAQRVAVSLGKALGLAVPPQAPVEGGGRSTLEWIGVGLAALLAAPLVLVLIGLPLLLWPALVLGWLLALLAVPLVILGWLLVRLLRLLRPTNDDPCPEVPGTPELPALRRPETLWQLLAIAAGVAALVVSAVLAAGLAGSVILWLRFWSSRLPADQSVDAVSKGELVATGTEALALFVLLGLVAVGLAWLLDSKGQLVRSTRRGLLAIAVVELIAAILIGDFRRSQALQLATGLVLGALLFHYLVDRALGLNVNLRSEAPGRALHDWISGLGGEVRKDFWPHLPRRLWQAVPFAVLVLAVWESLHAEGADRKLYVLLPLALAAALFVLPGGLAAKGTRRSRPAPRSSELRGLEAARIALAVAGLACVLVLITRDAAWLAGTAAVAALLALFCLTVAAASKDRFAPYALAILIAVPLFGAAAAMLRGIDSPELQPIAAILKSGEPVCGLYVGESDGKLWVGHLVLDEQGDVRRPRRGSILSVDSDRIAERTVGPLEPVALAQARAVELRDQLLNARGDTRLKRRLPTCEPPEPVPRVSQSWQRRLAERYQPELIVDRQDGFWPVPVTTLLGDLPPGWAGPRELPAAEHPGGVPLGRRRGRGARVPGRRHPHRRAARPGGRRARHRRS
jgi:hypothetical protein